MNTFKNISEVKAANTLVGHWFEKSTMRFFQCRLAPAYRNGPVLCCGEFFISSERYDREPRRYTIRRATPDGHIETVGSFQEYATLRAARAAMVALP